MRTFLDYSNLTMLDIDELIAFLQNIGLTITVKHDGIREEGFRRIPIGIGDCYSSIRTPRQQGIKI